MRSVVVSSAHEDLSSTFVVTAWLLLLVRDRPGHGYELIDRLHRLGIDPPQRSIYRHLGALEREGLVSSRWETPDAGPARRVFELTAAGEEALRERAERLESVVAGLNDFLARHQGGEVAERSRSRFRGQRPPRH